MAYKEGKKRGMSMERSKAGMKEKSPDGLLLPNQNTILINIMRGYFKTWKMYNEIQLQKLK